MAIIDFCAEKFLSLEYSASQLSFALFAHTECMGFTSLAINGDGESRWVEELDKFVPLGIWPSIKALTISQGPGTFTSLRISFASAYALAEVFQIPLCGVNTLETLAWALVDKPPLDKNWWEKPIITLVKAYGQEYYVAAYQFKPAPTPTFLNQGKMLEILAPQALKAKEIWALCRYNAWALGSGIDLLAERKELPLTIMPLLNYTPHARAVGYAYLNKELACTETLPTPFYLVEPHAVRTSKM